MMDQLIAEYISWWFIGSAQYCLAVMFLTSETMLSSADKVILAQMKS